MGEVISMRRIRETEPTSPEDILQEIVDAHLAYDLLEVETTYIALRLLEEDDRLEDCLPQIVH